MYEITELVRRRSSAHVYISALLLVVHLLISYSCDFSSFCCLRILSLKNPAELFFFYLSRHLSILPQIDMCI